MKHFIDYAKAHKKVFKAYSKVNKGVKLRIDPYRAIMPFGKHKGQLLTDIPLPYLEWVRDNLTLKGPLKKLINQVIKMRGK